MEDIENIDLFKEYPLWKTSVEAVREDDDVESWEQMVRILESVAFNYAADGSKPAPPQDLTDTVATVFDTLLGKWPLLVSFWKSYVSIVYQLQGLEASIKVFEKALTLAPNCLEIWIDYLSVVVANSAQSVEATRLLFQDAVKSVGRGFLSHPLWDQYIDWETQQSGENSKEVLDIVLQLLEIPLHQYAKYFTKFYELKPYFAVPDLIPEDTLKRILQTELSFEEYVAQTDMDTVNAAVDEHFNAIFEQTQRGTNERWVYESKISLFDFEMGRNEEELAAWEEYLDYEESQNIVPQTRSLYERALIPNANSETVWIRYLSWKMKHDEEDIEAVFDRACNLFVPVEYPRVRFLYSRHLERKGDLDAARNVFNQLLVELPSNMLCVERYLEFLNRTEDRDVVIARCEHIMRTLYAEEQMAKKQKLPPSENLDKLQSLLNAHNGTMVIVHLARHKWATSSVKETRDFFTSNYKIPELRECAAFWLLFFDFEKQNRNLVNMYEMIKYIGAHGHIPTSTINGMAETYLRLVLRNVGPAELREQRKELTALFGEILGSTSAKHLLKTRLSADLDEAATDKRLAAERGHPGISVPNRPRLCNPSPITDISSGTVAPLPVLEHVDQATKAIQYE